LIANPGPAIPIETLEDGKGFWEEKLVA